MAKIGRLTFYGVFSSRQACLEFSCAVACAQLTAPLEALSGRESNDRPARTREVVDALIYAIGREPLLAELCLVHSPSAAIDQPHRFRNAVIEATWNALGGDLMAEMAAGAIITVLTMQIARGATACVPDLREGLVGLSGC